MAEYSKMARGKVTAGSTALVIPMPFVPDYVEMICYTNAAISSAAAPLNVFLYWHKEMDGQAAYRNTVSAGANSLQAQVSTTSGLTLYSGGLSLQYGPQVQIVSISKASIASVVATGHGLKTGDVVILEGLFQSSTTGMPQIAGIPFIVTVSDANTFTIPWNTNQTQYTALSGSPTGAYMKKLLYPVLFMPGISFITAITTGTTTTITTTTPHNLVVGNEVTFRIPGEWGSFELNNVYGFVQSVPSATSVIVNINSTLVSNFSSNIPVANVSGLSFPQMIAVGDVNTGGVPYAVGPLYPGPLFNGLPTLCGPTTNGAFASTLQQGIIVTTNIFANGNVIYWRSMVHDYELIQ